MKSIILITLISLFSFSQEAIQGTIIHDNLEREYIIYIPMLMIKLSKRNIFIKCYGNLLSYNTLRITTL